MHGTIKVEDFERQLQRVFQRRLNLDIPEPETDILETGIVDSLTFVELLVSIEEEFGIPVDLAELDLEHFRSVRRIARFLAARQPMSAT